MARKTMRRPPRTRVDLGVEIEGDDEVRFEKISRPSAVHRVAPTASAQAREGVVVGVVPAGCRVEVDGSFFEAVLAPAVGSVVVGDVVRVEPGPSGKVRVRERLLRRTTLSRPDPHNPRIELVLAANVDCAIVVVSTRSPPLRTGLVDRFLLAVERGGAAPMVCVNKVDLVGEPERADALRQLSSLARAQVPVVFCSASSGEGMGDLAERIRDRTVVFVGQSGVGKSSLTNALGHAGRETGLVRAFDGKGRHTTTTSALVVGEGRTRIIDTPGIRSFGLWEQDREALRAQFRDVGPCRFRDCAHVDEPGCAVKEALGSGSLSLARYEAYLRMLSSLAGP